MRTQPPRDILDLLAESQQVTRYQIKPDTLKWLLKYGYVVETHTPMGFLYLTLTEKGKRRLGTG